MSALVKRHTFLKSFAILSVYRWTPLCPNRSPNLSVHRFTDLPLEKAKRMTHTVNAPTLPLHSYQRLSTSYFRLQ